ncbi:MAG: hypothetical protein U0353_29850 [Sandaracinus sp.]
MRVLGPCLAAFALASCGPSPSSDDAGTDAPLAVDDAPAPSDVGSDAGPLPPPTPTGVFPLHRRTALDWDRPDQGEAVPAADVELATDQLLDLLARTDWLDLVADRAHGWPESDPEGGYWYATWWSGVTVQKRGDHLTYVHSPDGADNNGLRTAQLLEGACYAHRIWGDPRELLLVRRLVRGFSSWSMSMERTSDEERGLLARAAYPRSVEDTARGISIDYAADRPGEPGPPSYYVHLTDNPYWPDVYVKNIRSKDDMGHMLRAVALLDTCEGRLGDADAEAELVEMRRLYQEWAQRVEHDGMRIASRDESGALFQPEGDLATYVVTAGIECAAGYAIPLLSRFDTNGYTCRNPGLGPVSDPATGIPSGALQILRTHHEAAAGLALASGRDDTARALLEGLAARMEGILDAYDTGTPPENAHAGDVVQLILESAALGVPLTSREVRFLHARLGEAAAGYDTTQPAWHVRDASVPDGDYAFEPGGPGVDMKDLALFLGLCSAQWVSPSGRAVIDCDRVRASTRPGE